jgi:hypothetical protein
LTGVRAELADAGYAGIPVGGSSEDNMATTMTALGITLLGECTTLAWRQARPGDGIYLVGRPYVGQEVLTHLAELLTPVRTQQLRTLPEVGDVLPCGSRGAAWELQVLTRETGLTIHVQPDINPELLSRSAGPATCAIVTAHEPFILEGISVERLGTVGDLLDLPSNP